MSNLKNHLTRAALTLLVMLTMTLTASATDFITDVMVAGNKNQSDFNTLIGNLEQQGWTDINQDLNAGAGGHYIHLLYKIQTSQGNSGTPITDFYIKTGEENPAATVENDGRIYYLVPCQGSDLFVEGQGDLNEGCSQNSDYIHLYYTKDALSNNTGVTAITFNTTQNGAVGSNGGSTGYDLNTGCGSGSAYIYMHLTTTSGANVVTLSSGSGEVQLQNDHILTGTGGANTHVTIADGATVTLSGVNITSIVNYAGYQWAGLTCLGNATIVLGGNTTNSVKGGYQSSGIFVPQGKTLTLQGSGTLNASGNQYSAGIGSGYESSCGNITISGGTVNATGGESAAGIGSSSSSNSVCGNIIISGGTINATGGNDGAGIGSGEYHASCGTITISGGTVTAHGGGSAAGIGSGYEYSSCGNITINGGSVTVYGGYHASGIGSGYYHSSCGDVTITKGVTRVTVTKDNSNNSIGKGDDSSTCGTVTIGGVEGSITESPFTTFPYTVAFNANGGTGTMADMSFMYGFAKNLTANIFTRSGYWFDGWALSPNGPWAYDDEQSVMDLTETSSATVTLYVKWREHLVTLTQERGNVKVYDGDILTGTGGTNTHVTIADGATVTFSGVDITAIPEDNNHQWPGITCLGNAEIVLAEGMTNSVKGGKDNPGIYAPQNKTLTLQGNGTLNATGASSAAGIGGKYQSSCGNITISDGTVTATGGSGGVGIGSGTNGSCGTITISGGTVTATGGQYGAGIGSGFTSTCGNITINSGTVNATGGSSAAGIGSGDYLSSCGNITINGGTVNATGGNDGAGIGSGKTDSDCGTVTISGGTITATGGQEAAGIGSGLDSFCGDITITNVVTRVTVTAGQDCNNTIGAGNHNSTCGTVTIGGIETGFITQNPFVILTKRITGYGTSTGGWHLIASPTADNTNVENVGGLISTTPAHYDLYRFNQAAELEWENWKAEGTDNYHFNLESGRGYLYASQENTTLVFSGTPYTGNGKVELTYTTDNSNENMRGWNLIGNPFITTANLPSGLSYYTMNEDRTELTPGTATTIKAMEAIFVKATASGQSVTFTQATRAPQTSPQEHQRIVLDLSHGGTVIDRAIVRFDEGQPLPKYQIHDNSTKVYIPQDGKNYAVINATGTDEIPVHFKAENNGTYSLTVSETFHSPLSTLHLIDNLTGSDIDLLATPSYTFTAKTTDYASRFKLVFSIQPNGEETDNDRFAFISNGNIIVNSEGMLQIIDMSGRQLFSHEVNSSLLIPYSSLTPGIYVLRLINGNEIKNQKILIP